MVETLGDLAKCGGITISTGPFGSALHAHDYQPTGVPVIPTEAIEPGHLRHNKIVRISVQKARDLARHRLQPGDIVFARGVQACGLSAPVTEQDGEVIAGTGVITLRISAREKIDPGFLACAVGAPDSVKWLKHHAIGATMPNLNSSIVLGLPICLPDIQSQRAIAHMLGTLDDKIELNRRMNETLEAMARALFKSWFVDFDPVRAQAEGRDPALPKHIADLFPDPFEDSEIGEIPRGWKCSIVGNHFKLTTGQSPPGSTHNESGDGLPFFQGRTDFGFRFPSRRVFCTAPTRLAEVGDTLVCVRAPVGDVNIAIEPCAVGRGVAAVRHRSGSRSFTYHAMHNLGDHFGKFDGEGTVFGSINKADFERLPVVAPPQVVLGRFDRIAAPIDDRVESNDGESRTLTTLRDMLLPKLISGELRVPVAEHAIENVQ